MPIQADVRDKGAWAEKGKSNKRIRLFLAGLSK